jgi:hypothetical protein
MPRGSTIVLDRGLLSEEARQELARRPAHSDSRSRIPDDWQSDQPFRHILEFRVTPLYGRFLRFDLDTPDTPEIRIVR